MRPILGRKFSSQLLLAGFGIGARLAPQTDAHRLSMSAVIGILGSMRQNQAPSPILLIRPISVIVRRASSSPR